jgi:hypothetical protein
VRLLDYINAQEHWTFHMDDAGKHIKVERKKMPALVAALEALNMVRKVSGRTYEWIAYHPPEHVGMRMELERLTGAIAVEKAKIDHLVRDGMAFVRPKALRHIMPGNTLIVLEDAPEQTMMELSVVSAWVEIPRLRDSIGMQPLKRYRLVLRCPTSMLNTHILHPSADVALSTLNPATLPTFPARELGLVDFFRERRGGGGSHENDAVSDHHPSSSPTAAADAAAAADGATYARDGELGGDSKRMRTATSSPNSRDVDVDGNNLQQMAGGHHVSHHDV